MHLTSFGWNSFFSEQFQPFQAEGLIPGRVAMVQKQSYVVFHEQGESPARLSGRFRYQSQTPGELPTVGDWVAIQLADSMLIQAVLPRKNCLTRTPPISGGRKLRAIHGESMIIGGTTEEQLIAANIDTGFIVTSLDDDFSLGRLERYLTLLRANRIAPVIVLNKADLQDDLARYREQVQAIAAETPVFCVSARQQRGLEALTPYLTPGCTACFLGSSGVGKSTMINAFLGADRQKTGQISEVTGKGRHVTTYRELIPLPAGGVLIDNPGIREVKIWGEQEDINRSFADIDMLFDSCRFRNCTHTSEPGCAVLAAIQHGELDERRYRNYLRQLREVDALAMRKHDRSRLDVRNKKRKLHAKDEYRLTRRNRERREH
ncbi:putative ribosome biogenesis GTPase RsgA 1 [Candidatus Moduliflexus flocculans]|uniref:Small ribosomal subunit biogenesis GTPase RsgA n=1 Tax=Candidatus Moduliflexus flocculans TaxID=1499966 RepID=A0A0S6W5V8_9BACT|nr:putative ribosome biogenesis GTPase RsgA 1 [Candidatus Moduliflexus flocculans]